MTRPAAGVTVAVFACVLVCGPTPAAEAPSASNQAGASETRLSAWASAVRAHQPGHLDQPATDTTWNASVLYMMFAELRALEVFARNPLVQTRPLNNQFYGSPRLSLAEVRAALRLGRDDVERGHINGFLLAAALLHTDIGLMVTTVPGGLVEPSPFSGRLVIGSEDGQLGRVDQAATHIEFASWLLDGIRPSPQGSDAVRGWYGAVVARLLFARRLGDAEWLAYRGLRLFSRDAPLQFLAGSIYETLAAPRVQEAFAATSSLRRRSEADLGQARAYFRRAVAIDPAFGEARLHLGRVVGQLGRHDEAVQELTAASSALADPALEYLCALFLGREFDALGQVAEARTHYARAAALMPAAQSPLIALSELARRAGDSAAARAPLVRLLVPRGPDVDLTDPWWRYDVLHVRDAEARLDAWRASVSAEARR